MSLTTIAARLRYAVSNPHGWQQFLDEKYEGGKALVNNPDPDGRKKQVSVNYALKTESFRHRLSEEYHKWYGENKEKAKNRGRPKKVNPDSKPVPVPQSVSNLTEDQKDYVDRVVSGNKINPDITIEIIRNNINDSFNTLKPYIDRQSEPNIKIKMMETINIYEAAKKIESEMTPQENFCLTGIHRLYPMMQGILSQEELKLKTALWNNWQGSSKGHLPIILHDILSKKGIVGSDPDPASVDNTTEMYKAIKNVADKAYAYQQDVFKHLGVTHVTLYRGIFDKTLSKIPPSHGDKVKIQTRQASSWTIEPSIATGFGYRIVKCRVPVENIIASPMIHPRLRDEFEYVVMGAEGLECEVFMGVFSQ